MCGVNKVLFHNWCAFFPSCLSLQWKFAFVLHDRPEFLQDSDIVSARFQVCQTFSFLCDISFWLWMYEFEAVNRICLGILFDFYMIKLIQIWIVCLFREGRFLVLRSNILDWNILTVLQKGLTRLTRYMLGTGFFLSFGILPDVDVYMVYALRLKRKLKCRSSMQSFKI